MITARPRLSKFLLAASGILGTASLSFALYVLPDALPLWRRTASGRPAPLEPHANLLEITENSIRRASAYILGLDLEDLRRLFYSALALLGLSAVMFFIGWKLRRKG